MLKWLGFRKANLGSSREGVFREQLNAELSDLEGSVETGASSPGTREEIDRFKKKLGDGLPYASLFAEARLIKFKSLLIRSIASVEPQAAATERCKIISALLELELGDLDKIDSKALELVATSISRDSNFEQSAYEFMRKSWSNDANKAIEQMETLQVIEKGARIALLVFLVSYLGSILFRTFSNVWGYVGTTNASKFIANEVFTALGNMATSPAFWCAFAGFVGAVISMIPQTTSGGGHWSTVRLYGRQVRLWLGALVGLLVFVLGPVLLGHDLLSPDVSRLTAISLAFGFSQDRFISKVQTFA
jgi:hypothetical protein